MYVHIYSRDPTFVASMYVSSVARRRAREDIRYLPPLLEIEFTPLGSCVMTDWQYHILSCITKPPRLEVNISVNLIHLQSNKARLL